MEEITQAAPAAIGAIGGGVSVFWFAKLAFRRMIAQYDQRHDEHEAEIKELRKLLVEADKQVAVLIAMFTETKNLRSDIQGMISRLEGELSSRHVATVDTVDDLRADLFVAHERIRLLATGDNDLSKIQKPNIVKRRV